MAEPVTTIIISLVSHVFKEWKRKKELSLALAMKICS